MHKYRYISPCYLTRAAVQNFVSQNNVQVTRSQYMDLFQRTKYLMRNHIIFDLNCHAEPLNKSSSPRYSTTSSSSLEPPPYRNTDADEDPYAKEITGIEAHMQAQKQNVSQPTRYVSL